MLLCQKCEVYLYRFLPPTYLFVNEWLLHFFQKFELILEQISLYYIVLSNAHRLQASILHTHWYECVFVVPYMKHPQHQWKIEIFQELSRQLLICDANLQTQAQEIVLNKHQG